MSRDDDEEEESPRHRRGKRGARRWFRVVSLCLIAALCILGIFYLVEKSSTADIADRYAACLSQNRVLDERFVDCSTQLQQCAQQAANCQVP